MSRDKLTPTARAALRDWERGSTAMRDLAAYDPATFNGRTGLDPYGYLDAWEALESLEGRQRQR